VLLLGVLGSELLQNLLLLKDAELQAIFFLAHSGESVEEVQYRVVGIGLTTAFDRGLFSEHGVAPGSLFFV